jgi:dTMP kinase
MEKLLKINLSSQKGLFITFEGGEGVGKTTQINLLKNFFEEQNLEVITTREPGGTEEGENIRKFLVSGKANSWDPYSEALIFNAIRREHINKVIKPAIENGKIVLCDRFIDSTIVYQGVAGNVNQSNLLQLHKEYCYNLYPAVTFFLNLNPLIGLERANQRLNQNDNRFESLGINYHNMVYDGFVNLQKKYPKRIINVEAGLNKSLISKKINSFIYKLAKINE